MAFLVVAVAGLLLAALHYESLWLLAALGLSVPILIVVLALNATRRRYRVRAQ